MRMWSLSLLTTCLALWQRIIRKLSLLRLRPVKIQFLVRHQRYDFGAPFSPRNSCTKRLGWNRALSVHVAYSADDVFHSFTQQVILKLSYCGDDITFEMDGSSDHIMYASGYIVGTFENAIQKIDSLSQALRAANFPHTIGVDDEVTNRSAQISYRARITTHWE